jgi:hypothetical protein
MADFAFYHVYGVACVAIVVAPYSVLFAIGVALEGLCARHKRACGTIFSTRVAPFDSLGWFELAPDQ